jgi:ribosome biogenesis GTPase
MKLSELGFDQWFSAYAAECRQKGEGIARVSVVDRGSYLIRNESGEVPAELAGRLS